METLIRLTEQADRLTEQADLYLCCLRRLVPQNIGLKVIIYACRVVILLLLKAGIKFCTCYFTEC